MKTYAQRIFQINALFVFGIFLTLPVRAESGYICVMEKATGFKKNQSGEWLAENFTADKKYNLTRAVGDDVMPNGKPPKYEWVVKEVGEKRGSYWCLGYSGGGEILRCGGFGGDFVFNKRSLRFQSRYEVGYVFDFSNGGNNTPYIGIGRCSEY